MRSIQVEPWLQGWLKHSLVFTLTIRKFYSLNNNSIPTVEKQFKKIKSIMMLYTYDCTVSDDALHIRLYSVQFGMV